MSEEETVRILVVDDEEVVHQSLRRIFSRTGYEVQSAYSAKAALEALDGEAPSLIITDLMMPEIDGITLLRTLREKSLLVPVVMITGYPSIRTAVEAMRLGAVDYVAKPFTRPELLGPVKRALSLKPNGIARRPPSDSAELLPLVTGAIFELPHHSWARLEQDGSFSIGIDETFLKAVGSVNEVVVPEELASIEQGHVGLHVTSTAGEQHGVAMPLSGQTVAVNRDVLRFPTSIQPADWLLRIIPSHLDDDLRLLVRRH